jgi:hypothetical protein
MRRDQASTQPMMQLSALPVRQRALNLPEASLPALPAARQAIGRAPHW